MKKGSRASLRECRAHADAVCSRAEPGEMKVFEGVQIINILKGFLNKSDLTIIVI